MSLDCRALDGWALVCPHPCARGPPPALQHSASQPLVSVMTRDYGDTLAGMCLEAGLWPASALQGCRANTTATSLLGCSRQLSWHRGTTLCLGRHSSHGGPAHIAGALFPMTATDYSPDIALLTWLRDFAVPSLGAGSVWQGLPWGLGTS